MTPIKVRISPIITGFIDAWQYISLGDIHPAGNLSYDYFGIPTYTLQIVLGLFWGEAPILHGFKETSNGGDRSLSSHRTLCPNNFTKNPLNQPYSSH